MGSKNGEQTGWLSTLPAENAWRRHGAHRELGDAQLRDALRAGPGALLIVDAGDRIRLASVGAERLLGASSGQLRRGSLWNYVTAAPGTTVKGLLAHAQAGMGDLQLVLPDGSTRRASLHALCDERGLATHVRLTLGPISTASVDDVLASVGRLAATLAHDVNNQLAAALNRVYVLRRRMQPDDPLSAHVADLQSAIWRAANLACRAKSLPSSRSTNSPLVPLNETVTRLVPLLQHMAGPVTIELRLAAELPDLCASLAELEQIVVSVALFWLHRARAGDVLSIKTATRAGLPTPDRPGSVRLICSIDPSQARHDRIPSSAPTRVDGTLKRALKRCHAKLGHDHQCVWVDFPADNVPARA